MADFDEKKLTTDNFFEKLSGWVDGPKDEAPPKNFDKLLNFLAGDDLMSSEYPDQPWVVENIIPEGGMICLSGMPSSYKSWFSSYLALRIMRGEPILEDPGKARAGWRSAKGSVLFIDKENIEPQIQKRMRMLGAGEEMKNCHFVQGNFSTENLKGIAEVVQFIKEKKIKLVIIDSLIRIHARNENDAVEMNRVFERLAEFQHAGAAVLYLHHLRKATNFSRDPMERLRGSIDIAARLDSLIAFENDEKNIIEVYHGKSRYTEAFHPFVMRFEVDQNNKAYFNYDKELDPGEMEKMLCIDAVYALIKKNSYTRRHLLEELGHQYSQEALAKAISDLYREHKIEKHQQGKEVIYSKNMLYEMTQQRLTEEEKEDLD